MSVSIKISLSDGLAVRLGNRSIYHLRMPRESTFGQLMIKLRRVIKMIDAAEALFLFIDIAGKRTLPPLSKTLGSYGLRRLKCFVTGENAFGTWNKMYVRSEIKQLDENAFIASITYSYYGLQHFTETKYCTTLLMAREWILRERCGKVLVEEIKTEKGDGKGEV